MTNANAQALLKESKLLGDAFQAAFGNEVGDGRLDFLFKVSILQQSFIEGLVDNSIQLKQEIDIMNRKLETLNPTPS